MNSKAKRKIDAITIRRIAAIVFSLMFIVATLAGCVPAVY